jgi:hypothetical protein
LKLTVYIYVVPILIIGEALVPLPHSSSGYGFRAHEKHLRPPAVKGDQTNRNDICKSLLANLRSTQSVFVRSFLDIWLLNIGHPSVSLVCKQHPYGTVSAYSYFNGKTADLSSNLLPNVVVKWLTLLLCIREIPGSSLGLGSRLS